MVFRCVDVCVLLQVLVALLLERKVIIFSKHKRLLVPVAQTLLTLLFPLEWQYSCISASPNLTHLSCNCITFSDSIVPIIVILFIA